MDIFMGRLKSPSWEDAKTALRKVWNNRSFLTYNDLLKKLKPQHPKLLRSLYPDTLAPNHEDPHVKHPPNSCNSLLQLIDRRMVKTYHFEAYYIIIYNYLHFNIRSYNLKLLASSSTVWTGPSHPAGAGACPACNSLALAQCKAMATRSQAANTWLRRKASRFAKLIDLWWT